LIVGRKIREHRSIEAAGHGLWRRSLPLIGLFAVSCVIYVNAGHQEFFFDSPPYILEDPVHRSVADSLALVWRRPFSPDESIAHLSFALNHALNRALDLPGFHVTSFLVVNVVIHAVNVCLLFLVLRGLLRTIGPADRSAEGVAFAAAMLFAVHPLHASTVVYTVQRRGELVLAFHLLATLAYLYARPGGLLDRRVGAMSGKEGNAGSMRNLRWRRWACVVAILACYWLSCRSKSVGMVLPLVLLGVEFCVRAPDPPARRRFVPVLGGGLVASVGLMLVYLWRTNLLDPTNMDLRFYGAKELWSPWTHFLTECRVFLHYWKLLFLPLPRWMSIDHDFALSTSLGQHAAGVALLFHVLVLTAAIIAATDGYPLAAAGVMWFYASLAPYLFVPQSELYVEYKTYSASIALSLLAVELLRRVRTRRPAALRAGMVAAPVLLLSVATISRNVIYQDELSLWNDAVAKAPHRPRCHASLGNALMRLGRTEEALARYEEAVRLMPDYHPAILNIANHLSKIGRLEEANRRYREVLRIDPTFAPAHNNWAVNLVKEGRLEEAIDHYRAAIQARPAYFDAYYNLSRVLAMLNRPDEAIEAVRQAVRLNPESVDARARLARLLVGHGSTEEAIEHYRAALELRPEDASIRLDLGNCLIDRGEFTEAVRVILRSLELNPHNPEAHNSVGTALLGVGDVTAAIEHFQTAIRMDPKSVNARVNLGLAHEAAGRRTEALAQYREALRIQPAHEVAAKRLSILESRPSTTATSPAEP